MARSLRPRKARPSYATLGGSGDEVEADEYQKRALNLAQIQAAFGPLMVVVVGVSNLVILYLGGVKYIEGRL